MQNGRIMYLKKIENKQEGRTREILNDIARKYEAEVFPKVRVADVLEIANSGLSNDEYSYALKAHFDYVVVNKDSMPEFVVEFDGLQHRYDASAIYKDKLKNNICRKLEMPLLRITSQYFEKIGKFPTILSWVSELHFLQKIFYDAQDKGEIPSDEPWMWFSVIGYDPFIHFRVSIRNLYEKGLCCDDIIGFVSGRCKGKKSYATLCALEIQNNSYIANYVECLAINYYAIPAREISNELSHYNIYKDIKKYTEGTNINTYTYDQILKMQIDFVEKHKICSYNIQLKK